MYRKIFISFLLLALINFLVGCYSSDVVNGIEREQAFEKDDIIVITKDYQEYSFLHSNFYVENDTLYGKVSVKELSFDGKFALWEIESIQFQSFDRINPSLISVTKYKKIETESGKPDEIYLTKYNSTKYHFMKNDYYIENDTLYGKGKLFLGDSEELLNKKIALSNIESIEVEYLNEATTTLLVLGIVAIPFVVVFIYWSIVGFPIK